ncbi:MAG: UDP-N-acetylglucosamine--LPS N-acetylglucosamine transferase [Sphingomonadales bacterium]|nr:MAG: UDP-N-acetylglucosamine--LPS N-acetylglucosamine transferase [Sphingomonadales bacterium]
MRILIVCSSGGHLTQALVLRPWWGEHERLWVTSPTPDAKSRLADEKVVDAFYPTVRNLPNLLRNIRLARRVLKEYRPDVVFSTGAAVAFPFFLLARGVGAATIFLEPIDRIDAPSLSGRLVYPFADRFFVQWPQMLLVYPRATDVGLVL